VEKVNQATNIKVDSNQTQEKVENNKREEEEKTQKNLFTQFSPN